MIYVNDKEEVCFRRTMDIYQLVRMVDYVYIITKGSMTDAA